MASTRDLSVALLMEDPQSAKEVSAALRQAGVFAHYHRDLDEFWVAVKMQLPDLAIVDVAKMSLGATQFKDHPCVRDGSLCVAFYHKDESRFLLQSAFGLPAYGYIHADAGLLPQVVALVERRKREVELAARARELEERVVRLQARSAKLVGEKSDGERFKSHFNFISDFVREVDEAASGGGEFATALFNRLADWAPVRQVGMYELAPNRHKLVAPGLARKKWLALPALWLGKECTDGIEPFALDMAWQVARDLFELPPVELRLSGGAGNPELVAYLDVDQEALDGFPWELMSTLLSGAWRHWRLQRRQPRPTLQSMPVWEALDRLDQLRDQGSEAGEKPLLLSLVPMLELVKKDAANRFHYTACYNEFFLQLGSCLHETTRTSFCGPWHVLLMVRTPFIEREHAAVTALLAQFPFWRFFEDDAKVLGEEARPTLKPLAPSAVAYLRTLEREFDAFPAMQARAALGQAPGARPLA